MEERLFLDWVALHATNVSPWHIQLPALVVADFANPRLAFRNGTAVSACETADAITLDRLVQFTLANMLIQDFGQGGQQKPLSTF